MEWINFVLYILVAAVMIFVMRRVGGCCGGGFQPAAKPKRNPRSEQNS